MKGEKRQSDGERMIRNLTQEERAERHQKALEDRERFRREQQRKRAEKE
jgi:hypothetical protein